MHGTQAYIRPDGATIASTGAISTDDALQNGISIDELGGNQSGSAWTATNSGGAGYTGNACAGLDIGARSE